ncbi:MAG: 30S ribosomal protein S8e [Methanomassiliicoccales archaeon]|jgi:small subunit ribosomal protein S8e
MALWQGKSQRKPSGGRLRPAKKKRRFEVGRDAEYTYLGETRSNTFRVTGGNQKAKLLKANYANVVDPATKKIQKSKILTVKENAANPNYVQRNIINRGSIIQTELGLAKVTSRPGQDGAINAVLVK